jgi:YVTN family beta-propeller protein
MGVGEGSVWVSDYNADQVYRLDAATGKQIAVVKLPPGSSPEGITDAGGAVWVADHHGGSISRIDPQTNKVAAKVVVGPPGSSGPQGIASGLGSVWVDVPNINSVVRIDPTTNKITAFIAFPFNMAPCGGIAVGTSAVWVTGCLDGTTVARIDPATNTIASILDVSGEVIQPAAVGNTVWFVASGDPDSTTALPGYLIHLRGDDTVAASYELPVGFITGGTTVAFGSIWISDFSHPRVMRIPPSS